MGNMTTVKDIINPQKKPSDKHLSLNRKITQFTNYTKKNKKGKENWKEELWAQAAKSQDQGMYSRKNYKAKGSYGYLWIC